MMELQGWTDLIADVTNIVNSINDIHKLQTQDQLQFSKGELSILEWILTLKNISEATYASLQAEDELGD